MTDTKMTLKEFVEAYFNEKKILEEGPIVVGRQTWKGLPEAACVLVVNESGLVLAVSRKDDCTKFGLPGGKLDPGEEPLEAAFRELGEETGLVATSLVPVFSWSDGEYLTHAFIAQVKGTIATKEAGVVEWVHPDVLLRGPFGEYNRRLFDEVGGIL